MDTPTDATISTTQQPTQIENVGSGQSGGGTADALPAAPERIGFEPGDTLIGLNTLPAAPFQGESFVHMTADDVANNRTVSMTTLPVSTTLLAGEFAPNGGVERSLVHIEAPELAAAALAANQQPAPTDPIEQIVSQLHTRVSALEDMAAQPSTVAEIASLRSAVDSVINWMETQAPLMDKVWHLFNVHWAGKMPDAPVTPETTKGI